ncbi:MAG: LytR C-terminal domain-containing protein [Jatrophihabitantaceae bacterium]
MAHLAPHVAPRRTAERSLGAVLLVAGMFLAVIAYSGLSHSGAGQGSSILPRPLATPPAMAAGQAVAGASRTLEQAGQSPTAVASTPVPGSAAGPPLIVLDNTGRPELARGAAERFEQSGWTVTRTSTFDGDILSTAAYYDSSATGAQAAAEALQARFPEIKRVLPKFDGLGPGAVVVVLTYDYSQGQTTS